MSYRCTHTSLRSEFTNLGAGPEITLLAIQAGIRKAHADDPRYYSSQPTLSGFLSAQNYNIETEHLSVEPLFQESVDIAMAESDAAAAISFSSMTIPNYLHLHVFWLTGTCIELSIEFDNMLEYISDSNVDLIWTSAA